MARLTATGERPRLRLAAARLPSSTGDDKHLHVSRRSMPFPQAETLGEKATTRSGCDNRPARLRLRAGLSPVGETRRDPSASGVHPDARRIAAGAIRQSRPAQSAPPTLARLPEGCQNAVVGVWIVAVPLSAFMLAEGADRGSNGLLRWCARSSTWGYGQNPNRALKGKKNGLEKFGI